MSFEIEKINRKDKKKFYQLLTKQVEGLLSIETDFIANAANLSSLLYHNLPDINWVGFYLLKNDELRLGPFHGQIACTRIAVGQGVCGTALSQNKTIVVDDVNEFAGHIACDSASASEIVIPLMLEKSVIAVLDIDSPITARFDETDTRGLQKIAQIFCKCTRKI